MILPNRYNINVTTILYVGNTSDIEEIVPENIEFMHLIADSQERPMMQVIEQSRRGEIRVTLFPLRKGWQVFNCKEFLRSLNTGLDIHFESFRQFNELIEQCFELITRG